MRLNKEQEDPLCFYIPPDVITDHNHEMKVEVATLEKIHQRAKHGETSLMQMPHICSTTSSAFESTMTDLCNEFQSIFSDFSILDDVSDKEHFEIIVVKDAKPQFVTLGRIPLFQREKMNEFITLFLKLGIIEPSNSSWGARRLLIKKDEFYRFCLNFPFLKEVTQGDN